MTLSTFIQCAQAFEIAFLSDDFSVLAPFYSDDAVHELADGGPFGAPVKNGRDNVLEGLRLSVNSVDRRFDIRIPEIIEGPEIRDEGIWMRFRLSFSRAGLPDLSVEGEHLQVFKAGKCVKLAERLAPGHGQRAADYLAQHDSDLKPVASPYAPPPSAAYKEALELAARRSFVRIYGAAKSRQDIEAALMVCSDDFSLEAVSIPGRANNKQEAQDMLQGFFAAFPDYSVTLDHIAPDGSACWGNVTMTHGGDFLGIPASGNRIYLPFYSTFEFDGPYLSDERFFLDIGHLTVLMEDHNQVLLALAAAVHERQAAQAS
ncbi:MAG: SnoaL-like domain-containing protein [Rhodobiaceae bacterium]|nr:SnoaL-like domain-containing protein [Rhodobiaceae bacterium]